MLTNVTETNNFIDIADIILNNYVLTVKDTDFRLYEIEFYKYSKDHADTYTHCHIDQKTYGKFYFHKLKSGTYKSGTFKGMDLTFGNNDCYYGILIRAMYNTKTKEYIEGPCKCVDALLSIFDFKNVSELMKDKTDLISFDDTDIKFHHVPNLEKYDVYHGPRIGLTNKYPDYHTRNYRFVIFQDRIKKLKKSLKLAKSNTVKKTN